MMGLVSAGFLASALTPTPQVATATDDQAALIREGKQLYDTSCITCHGANLQGVQDRGPSLIGVGEAAVYFQVSSGRMPASRNEAQVERKPVKFDAEQTDAIGAYVQANGGGPTVIRDENGEVAQSCCAAATSDAAASCSASTARPATTSPGAAARCRPASTRRSSTRPTSSRSTPRWSPARRTCPSSRTVS